MQRLLVFASGTADSGGSGFKNLVIRSRGDNPDLEADIVGVVSQYEAGGVRSHAEDLGIPFFYFPGPYTAADYQRLVMETGADWVALSGWLKKTVGLDPDRTINIHPGPLPRFGGKGMYGHHVHEAVLAAYQAGEITHTGVTMHFVTEEFDAGPRFFWAEYEIGPNDDAGDICARVNMLEHYWQPRITNEVIRRRIRWDGKDPDSLYVEPCLRVYLPR